MGNKYYIQEDRSKIKSITFKYPELTNEHSEEFIKSKHAQIFQLKEEISKQSRHLTTLQDQLANAQKEFQNLSELFDIEYETITKEYQVNNANIMIQGHGNSIIGKTSKL